MSSIR